MSFVSGVTKFMAKVLTKIHIAESKRAADLQHDILTHLINVGVKTKYWQENGIQDIRSYSDFKKQVPLVTYIDIAAYANRIRRGELDVMWLGCPKYLVKGVDSIGYTKYIPVTKESFATFSAGAQHTLAHYFKATGSTTFASGQLVTLTRNNDIVAINGISIGSLGAISNKLFPWYLLGKRLPKRKTCNIEKFLERVHVTADDCLDKNVTSVAGGLEEIELFFKKMEMLTTQKAGEAFPNLSVLFHRIGEKEEMKKRVLEECGREVDFFSAYVTDEAYVATQYSLQEPDMLLLLNNNIFYEFIPVDTASSDNPVRLSIEDVKLNEEYFIAVSTPSGLWAYMLDELIRFTSLQPYKIVVTKLKPKLKWVL